MFFFKYATIESCICFWLDFIDIINVEKINTHGKCSNGVSLVYVVSKFGNYCEDWSGNIQV